jgi:hypothetical protein
MKRYVVPAVLITVVFMLTLAGEQLAHQGFFPAGEHAWYMMVPLIPAILYLSLWQLQKVVYRGHLSFLRALRDGGLIVMIASLLTMITYTVYVATIEREHARNVSEGTLENEARAGVSDARLAAHRRVFEIGGHPFVQGGIMLFFMLAYGGFSTLYVSAFIQITNRRADTDHR